MTVVGWLERALMYSDQLLAFRKRNYISTEKLKKIRFISFLIDSLSFLNNAITSFLFLSSFGQFTLHISARPLSLHTPVK